MINQRIFSANVGDSSVGNAGPDAIEQDIDNLLANDQELLANDQELLGILNDHETQINSLGAYAVATGTNDYLATISGYALGEGKAVKIKFTNANTGASTLNINGTGAKSIVKGNGSALSSGNIKAGQICNLVYTGSVFQLLGEGGEYGTATASDVLQGKTIGTEDGLVEGTMVDRGTVNQTLTQQGQQYIIPSGKHSGSGKVTASFSNLSADNVRSGVNIGGIVGTYLGNGKRFATGSKSSSNSKLTVSQSFGFVPSIIIAKNTSTNATSVYYSGGLSKDYKFVYVSGSNAEFAADIISVSSSGFSMKATYNDNYNWIAIE